MFSQRELLGKEGLFTEVSPGPPYSFREGLWLSVKGKVGQDATKWQVSRMEGPLMLTLEEYEASSANRRTS